MFYSSQSVTETSVLSLGRDLYTGVKDDFFAYFCLGTATAICLFIFKTSSILEQTDQVAKFFAELGSTVSSISPKILLASIFVMCISVALCGFHEKPGLTERYLFHPLVALTSDSTASALGFFLASSILALFTPEACNNRIIIADLGYFLFASPIFWAGRSIAFRHGNEIVWSEQIGHKQNGFKSIFRALGVGGATACILAIVLSSLF